jgi:glutamyl-tRNA synthetase
MREEARLNKLPPRYTGKCRSLSAEDIAAREGMPYAIRFKVSPGTTVIDDLVQGRVETENSEFDDFVILKPNGDPIFHLAVVVDDGEMEITHVLRGDDHLTNAFRHVMLFKALGYRLPEYGHLPMVLDEHGKKYSKRLHGANVLDWRDDGYLPETMLNYVALMGWNPGDERELFTKDELLEAFSIKRLGKSPAKFDLKRLQWLNGQHMRMLPPEELTRRVLPLLERAGLDYSVKPREWLVRMASICQEKLRTLNEIVEYTDFFFVEPTAYEEKAVKKQWQKDGAEAVLAQVESLIQNAEPWSHETLHAAFEAEAGRSGLGLGALVHPTRLALTGKSIGPGLFELAELLGRETCLARIERAQAYVKGLSA